MAEYAHPDSLVSTEWVAEHGSDANVRLIEVDVDTAAYEQGHIAGAVGWNWQSQLQQSVRRDLLSKEEMEQLLGGSGAGNEHHHRGVRRQQQLVRRLGLLADPVLRPRGR